MKEINIRIYLQGVKEENDKGEITIDTDAVSKDILQAFEFIGVYEFIKREIGNDFATILLIKIDYDENKLSIRHKAYRKGSVFKIENAMDKMIDDEMNNIKKKFQGVETKNL